jgi:hypothetical protein
MSKGTRPHATRSFDLENGFFNHEHPLWNMELANVFALIPQHVHIEHQGRERLVFGCASLKVPGSDSLHLAFVDMHHTLTFPGESPQAPKFEEAYCAVEIRRSAPEEALQASKIPYQDGGFERHGIWPYLLQWVNVNTEIHSPLTHTLPILHCGFVSSKSGMQFKVLRVEAGARLENPDPSDYFSMEICNGEYWICIRHSQTIVQREFELFRSSQAERLAKSKQFLKSRLNRNAVQQAC